MRRLGRKSWVFLLTAVFSLSTGACGNDGGDDDQNPGDPDAANPGTPDAAPTGDWTDLIATEWSLPAAGAPDSEGYYCASKTLTEKTYLGAFRPINPVGTHHTVVSFGPPTTPDSPSYKCNAGTENPNWIYASGVGTGELMFPEGVGIVLEAGTQVHVNLHLFNTTDNPLTGRSGVQVIKLEQSKVVHEAELFLPGPVGFSIPGTPMNSQPQPYSLTGKCTAQQEQTLFALFPHMHQIGVHFKTEIVRAAGGTEMVWDKPYDFENQPFAKLDLIQLHPGDKINTTCTWINPKTTAVGFGQSSTNEMCFSILMRYPRLTDGAAGNFCFEPF